MDEILRLCANAAPGPWYPSRYVGDRESLDEPLTKLRVGGLVRLTEWQPGTGQGYELTAAGRAVLDNPRAAGRLRGGQLPAPSRPVSSRRPREQSDAAASLFTVTNLLVSAMIVTFGVGMQLALNAGVPASVYLRYGNSPVLNALAFSPQAISAGEWWRLWTYALVHVGGLHLLLNVYGHLIDGPVTEEMFGHGRFLVLYLFATFGGALGALLTSRSVAGSSGAWCGLIGAQVAYMAFHRRRYTEESVRDWRLRTVHVILLTALISTLPNVSWEGHLGGAVAGFVAGVLLILERDGTRLQRWLGLFSLVFLAAVGLGYVGRGKVANWIPWAAPRARTEFIHEIAPVAEAIQRRAANLLDDIVDPLCGQKPERRDPERVRAAREGVAVAKAEANAVLTTTLRRAYLVNDVEAAREATANALALTVQVLGEYAECLHLGPDWRNEQEGRLLQLRVTALEAEIHRRRTMQALKKP